jgi:hypothetical protein
MTDQKTDGTTAARSREPVAEPYAVGISPLVKERLAEINLNPEIKKRIESHLQKKNG